MPRNQHHPTPEEMDERVKVDIPADKFIRGVMEAGDDPEEGDEEDEGHTYTLEVGEVPEPGTPGTEELIVVQRGHKPDSEE